MTIDRDAQPQPDDPGAGRLETSRTRDGMVATAFGMTDVGRQRKINQDTLGNRVGQYAGQTADSGLLYALADGMGGHARGEVASALAIEQLFARYYGTDPRSDPRQVLARVMNETNAAVFQAGRESGGASMGTTLTLALLRNGALYIGNIGDSRTYLVRNRQIEQLTHDHSLIGEQVRSGLLTEAQARQSNIRNVITRAVGYREQVEPDVFTFPIAPNDILLLCSDGLHGLVENEELAQILSAQPIEAAVPALIELAKQRGGHDNITALAVRIDQLGAASGARDDVVTAPLTRSMDDAITKPSVRVEESTEPRPQAAPVPPPGVALLPVGAAPAPARPAPAPASQSSNRLTLGLFIVLPILLLLVVGGGVVALRGSSASPNPTSAAEPTSAPPPAAVPTTTAGAASSAPPLVASVPSTQTPVATRAPQSSGPSDPTPQPLATSAASSATASARGPATTPTAGASTGGGGEPNTPTLLTGTITFSQAINSKLVTDQWELLAYAASAFPTGSVGDRPTTQQLAAVEPTWHGTIKSAATPQTQTLNYEIQGKWSLVGTDTQVYLVLRHKADKSRFWLPEQMSAQIKLNETEPHNLKFYVTNELRRSPRALVRREGQEL